MRWLASSWIFARLVDLEKKRASNYCFRKRRVERCKADANLLGPEQVPERDQVYLAAVPLVRWLLR